MAQELDITIRRAKASDAERIANFVNHALQDTAIGKQAVIERLGGVAFLLAEIEGELVGVIGWRVENLVARVTDFLVRPARIRYEVGRDLFAAMEASTVELQGEAALLFLPYPVSSDMVEFCQTLGYESRPVTELPKAWQEAAQEVSLDEDEAVMVRKLRSDRVIRPL